MQQFLAAGDRVGRHGCESIGDAESLGEGLPTVCHPIDNAQRVQLPRAHGFGQPDPLLQDLPGHGVRQMPRGAAVGREPDLGVREDESGVFASDDQVARHREREARAGCSAFDGRDHRLGKHTNRFDELVQLIEHLHLRIGARLAPRREPVQIAARAKIRAVAAQDDGADLDIGLGDIQGLDAGRNQLLGERVARGGVAQG